MGLEQREGQASTASPKKIAQGKWVQGEKRTLWIGKTKETVRIRSIDYVYVDSETGEEKRILT